MKRREFLRAAGAAAAAALMPRLVMGQSAPAARRPNFVVILADDIGAGHYGCYGNAKARTPHLDALARTGVMFRTCWATPMCGPSRTLLATGRYAWRTGVYHNSLAIPVGGKNPGDFASTHLTFARVLKQAGYATAIAGKIMSLGGRLGSDEVAFDEHCIHHESFTLPDGSKFDGPSEGAYHVPNAKPIASRYWHPCLVRNGKAVKTGPRDFAQDIHTDFLIDFARRHKDGPFLAYFTTDFVHGIAGGGLPTSPAAGRPGKNTGGNVDDCNSYLDVLVGRIVKALDELHLREDTIILFTSDNGDGPHGKTWATEQGARVPMIVNCPGRVKPRGATNALTDFADVMPTLVDFAKADVPKGYELDGRSLAPFLTGQSNTTREWIYSYIGTARMIRDGRWLLEGVDPLGGKGGGRMYDCGEDRSGHRYREVTGSTEPEVQAARRRLGEILAKIPHIDPHDASTATRLANYKKAPYRHQVR
ncbi:MAG: sulfatase-like hydrolase/transferase [Planctomycetaceae bacterium]|nr:sulfatase-like hydrolase/transferase [Planctomycetaceae bacterium]